MAPRCQCDPSCKLLPEPGSAFCIKHRDSCPIKSPMSGYEPAFGHKKYNERIEMLDSHNCFAYALDYVDIPDKEKCNKDGCDVPFHQPGRASGYPKWSKVKGKRCPDLLGRLKGDIPNIERTTFTRKCKNGFYKVALVIDPINDYHFYRQDSNGMWSHKPGGTKVTRLDASKRPINNPELADRDYKKNSDLDYKKFCSFLCVPTRQTKRLKRGGSRKRQTTTRSRRRSE